MSAPDVLRLGPARLTAGLDQYARLDLPRHRTAHGPLPRFGRGALLDLVERLDLRGRGGAGFPFARKARAALATGERTRQPLVVVVNATEGEPASAKDRMLLTRAPHLILDGACLAAEAFGAEEIVIGVAAGGPGETSIPRAIAEREREQNGSAYRLPCPTRAVCLPERFVSGESGALIRGISGLPAVPPARRARATDGGPAGVRGRPTLLSNAETYAQLAVAARLGPDAYAVVGTPAEPGTLLLTLTRPGLPPLVVEVPAGAPLGQVLDACGIAPGQGLLVGGYHGAWLRPQDAAHAPVSRAGLAAVGGTLGAGAVASLPADTCPLGEVARITAWLAAESAGQCGPCRLGLPDTADALAQLATAGGGPSALDQARRTITAVRGRGACAHPDGTARFVLSALEVFAEDLAVHESGRGCGRPVRGVLPLPGDAASALPAAAEREPTLEVDWTRCDGHGLCAALAPELITLGPHGYPVLGTTPIAPWLTHRARRAVSQCPALALRLRP
ncbi:NADH-ubiquinone oxidoreductase-F iron-sulfur binding region domain-containing protein [Streptacidiphilus sp. N1-12]|uniref:NADH-ubiquinone oxidoreductase-F iron-sulfur binding region domain-containing protein n=2 Tax=Streptacidiphilus alkalitolerans TaxID=3342712 RepID=A0ABV6WJX0_9ACTN